MNWKVILLLLAVTLGLGTYLFLQDEPLTQQPQEQPELDRVLAYSPDEVTKVTVIYEDTTYVVVRQEREWSLEQPDPGWGADSMVINHLLRTLSEMPYGSSIPVMELNLADVKLDDPVLVFTAYRSETDSIRLEFGTLNPTTENIYILISNEGKVALANRLLGRMMTVNGFLVRGKSLTGVHPFSAVKIEVENRGQRAFAAGRKTSNDRWMIEATGRSLLADKRRMNLRLGELYSGQVREFVSTGQMNLSATGLNRPQRRVTLISEDRDTTVISFGRIDPDDNYLRWARSSVYPDHFLLVDAWLVDKVDLFSADSMTSRRLADIVPSEVDFISLASPLDSLVFIAENDTLWNLITPQTAKAKYLEVEQLLAHVDTMSGSSVIFETGDRGYDSPQTRLMLMKGDSVLADVVVGFFVEDNVYVRDNVRNIDFLASSSDLEPLNATFRDVADIPVRHVVE